MERSVPLPVAGGRAALRLSRPPLRLAAPTALPFIAGKKANAIERDCFETTSIVQEKPVMTTLLALNGTDVPSCPRLYGSLAPSRLFAPPTLATPP